MTDVTRGTRMGDRVGRTFIEKGGSKEDESRLKASHNLTVTTRASLLDDDHDPRFLHPGRSALILLLDCGVTQVDVLSMAIWHDSEDEGLAPSMTQIADLCPAPDVDLFLERILALPCTGDEDLAEALLELDDDQRLVAVAERMDHLRHLHLREVNAEARRIWSEAEEVWLPIAQRTNETLARRIGWWVRKFESRYS